MKKVFGAMVLLLLALVAAGCSEGGEKTEVTVYKSSSCGCCVGYIAELERNGFEVKEVNVPDMGTVKRNFGIPASMSSCHTVQIGDYFVEGHVPIEAVMKLLEERPAIDGIALPGMPAGSPGMPGAKSGTWNIYSLKDRIPREFMKV